MINEISGKHELLAAINEAVTGLVDQVSALDQSKINSIPFKDSWTAGELARHVTKSINGMAKAMGTESKLAQRDEADRIPQLKKIFLDFSHKLQSPEFIIPEKKQYEKQAVIEELKESYRQFKVNSNNANLREEVVGLPLGPITKLEIIHFVLYHTQRHLQQMKKIVSALRAGSFPEKK